MIKTVFLECCYPSDEQIDIQINNWFIENPGISLIDIKLQSNLSAVADSGVSAQYWYQSALIIYKEAEKSKLGAELGEEDDC